MNTVLWILQGFLASAFLGVGLMKLTKTKEKLETKMGWVSDFTSGPIKTIGLLEILAGLGLIIPAVLDIVPVLTAWAAIGLIVLMIGAALTHARRNEPHPIVLNFILAALAAVAAWGRFGTYSF